MLFIFWPRYLAAILKQQKLRRKPVLKNWAVPDGGANIVYLPCLILSEIWEGNQKIKFSRILFIPLAKELNQMERNKGMNKSNLSLFFRFV